MFDGGGNQSTSSMPDFETDALVGAESGLPPPMRGVLKSTSMERGVFGRRTLGGRKKSYLNQRQVHPDEKDKNKGSVLKSIGKFLRDDNLLVDDDDNDDLGAGSNHFRFLGARLGMKKKEGAEGWANLNDDDDNSFEKDATEHTVPESWDTPVFEIDPENPITMMGNSLQLNLSVSQGTGPVTASPNSSVSTLSLGGKDKEAGKSTPDDDDLTISSVEDSVGLNDSASIGIEDFDNEEYEKPLPSDDDHKAYLQKVAARRRRSESDNGSRGHQSSRDGRAAPRRSRSITSRRANGDLASSDHSVGASSVRSNRSTRSTRSIRSTKGGPRLSRSERKEANSISKSDHAKPREASRRTSISKSEHAPPREESRRTRSVSRSGVRSAAPHRHVERGDSSKDIRQKYQERSSMHRHSLLQRETSERKCRSIDLEDEPVESKSEEFAQPGNTIQFKW